MGKRRRRHGKGRGGDEVKNRRREDKWREKSWKTKREATGDKEMRNQGVEDEKENKRKMCLEKGKR